MLFLKSSGVCLFHGQCKILCYRGETVALWTAQLFMDSLPAQNLKCEYEGVLCSSYLGYLGAQCIVVWAYGHGGFMLLYI